MPARRRPQPRSPLNRAVKAGRKALRQAEKRIPPDLRRQIERGIKDGQKRFDATVKDVRTRVSKATAPGEIDRALKRFSGLSKQFEGLARTLSARAAAATRGTAPRRTATRRTATPRATPAKRKPATRKPAARKPAARKPAARRSPRRAAAPAIVTAPPSVPEAPGSGEG